jgi:hypothetical protein
VKRDSVAKKYDSFVAEHDNVVVECNIATNGDNATKWIHCYGIDKT